ncbi:hypothetical protein PybrP1_012805 [[Pythium] brassicae (nom. inval.)]|nr:hypothetical protein PybrP1_012805 [[Pythium] brassicae (nom. inval.)]
MGWLLAVHTGAGRYATCDEPAYVALMKDALQSGAEAIEALSAAAAAAAAGPESSPAALVASRMLRVFEHSELTNAGVGANLTARGRVECEASVVCGRSALASTCAKVRGVAEPSALAHALMVQAGAGAPAGATTDSAFAFGRQAPLVVVGKHARTLARGFGLETADSDADLDAFQVTPRAEAHWRKWHARFEALGPSVVAASASHGAEAAPQQQPPPQLLDTVGAICVDPFGNVAAALSSGGVAYKVPGRVGLAGCPRMGCNAANPRAGEGSGSASRKRKRKRDAARERGRRRGFAVACSGRGEHFIRSSFVAKLSHALGKSTRSAPPLDSAMRNAFVDSQEDNGGVPIEGGVLALSFAARGDQQQETAGSSALAVQLGAAFSTPCMGVGFLHSGGDSDSSAQPHPHHFSYHHTAAVATAECVPATEIFVSDIAELLECLFDVETSEDEEVQRVWVVSSSHHVTDIQLNLPGAVFLEGGKKLHVRVRNEEAELRGSIATQVFVNNKCGVRTIDSATAACVVDDNVLVSTGAHTDVLINARQSGSVFISSENGLSLRSFSAGATKAGVIQLRFPFIETAKLSAESCYIGTHINATARVIGEGIVGELRAGSRDDTAGSVQYG